MIDPTRNKKWAGFLPMHDLPFPSNSRGRGRAYCDRGPTRTPCYVDDRAEWLPGRQSGIWVHRQAAMNSRPAIPFQIVGWPGWELLFKPASACMQQFGWGPPYTNNGPPPYIMNGGQGGNFG